MDKSNKEIEKDCKEYLRHELKSADRMKKIVEENSVDEVNQAMSDVADELLVKIEDPEREKVIYAVLARLGKAMGSQSMFEFGAGRLESMEETDG